MNHLQQFYSLISFVFSSDFKSASCDDNETLSSLSVPDKDWEKKKTNPHPPQQNYQEQYAVYV